MPLPGVVRFDSNVLSLLGNRCLDDIVIGANTTTGSTSTQVLQNRWICNVCKVKWFLDFNETCEHEKKCGPPPSLSTVEDDKEDKNGIYAYQCQHYAGQKRFEKIETELREACDNAGAPHLYYRGNHNTEDGSTSDSTHYLKMRRRDIKEKLEQYILEKENNNAVVVTNEDDLINIEHVDNTFILQFDADISTKASIYTYVGSYYQGSTIMGRRRLRNTDEERATARRASQKKHDKKRNSPETLLRQSMKDKRRRIEAGSKIPQDYVDITNNHPSAVQQPMFSQHTYNGYDTGSILNWNHHLMPNIPYYDPYNMIHRSTYHQLMTTQTPPSSCTMINDTNTTSSRTDTASASLVNQKAGTDHSKELVDNKSNKECTSPISTRSKSTKRQRQRYNNTYYQRLCLLNKYKKVFGVEIVDYLKQHDQLQMMNINGNIVPHLTHTAQRMLMTSIITTCYIPLLNNIINNNGNLCPQTTANEQNITDKDSTSQTESVVDAESNSTFPDTHLNQSPIPVPSVCISSSNIDNAYDQDTDDEDATHLDSKPSPVPSSCTSGNIEGRVKKKEDAYDLDTDNEDMDDKEEGSDHKYEITEEHPVRSGGRYRR